MKHLNARDARNAKEYLTLESRSVSMPLLTTVCRSGSIRLKRRWGNTRQQRVETFRHGALRLPPTSKECRTRPAAHATVADSLLQLIANRRRDDTFQRRAVYGSRSMPNTPYPITQLFTSRGFLPISSFRHETEHTTQHTSLLIILYTNETILPNITTTRPSFIPRHTYHATALFWRTRS